MLIFSTGNTKLGKKFFWPFLHLSVLTRARRVRVVIPEPSASHFSEVSLTTNRDSFHFMSKYNSNVIERAMSSILETCQKNPQSKLVQSIYFKSLCAIQGFRAANSK